LKKAKDSDALQGKKTSKSATGGADDKKKIQFQINKQDKVRTHRTEAVVVVVVVVIIWVMVVV
jgi:hypothetical protein